MNHQHQYLILNYAISLVGRPGKWGGNDPIEGYDCSGVVQEILMAFGCLKRTKTKYCAQQLWGMTQIWQFHDCDPRLGDLVFYGVNDRNVNHVGFCVDSQRMIHAGSVDPTVIDDKSAADKNSFVRVDRIDYRAHLLGFVRPNYPGMDL